MRRTSVFVLAIAAASLTASAAAQSREIVVQKHGSFLDPGNVVPVGTEQNYVVDSTRLNYAAPGGAARRDELHQGLLPRPGDPAGQAPD